MWVAPIGGDAIGDPAGWIDDAYYANLTEGVGYYTLPRAKLRGAFKYLTLTLVTDGFVEISRIGNYFTALPDVKDDELRNYTGYFYSNDDLLNRVRCPSIHLVKC